MADVVKIDFDPLIPMAKAAEMLTISVKTLTRHVQDGNITAVIVGCGMKSPRRSFRLSEINRFIARREEIREWLLGDEVKRAFTTTASSSKVVSFLETPGKPTSAMPKNSKRKSSKN